MTMTFSKDTIAKSIKAFSHADPERDWFVLITIATLVLAILTLWNVWAFNTVASGGVISTSPKTVAPLVDRAALDTVHGIFRDRAIEEGKYVTGTYQYRDPSQ